LRLGDIRIARTDYHDIIKFWRS